MKILFVSEYYPPYIGGAEILFKNLAEKLAKEEHECHIITCKLPNTEKYEEIQGVKVHRVKVPRKGARYWFTFLAIPKTLNLARQVDLIHTRTYNAAFPAWLASRLCHKKCIITVHEILGSSWKDLSGMGWFSSRLHQLLEKFLISLPFDRYVCVSRHGYDSLKVVRAGGEKLEVIYNGVDIDLFNSKKADGERIRRRLGLGNHFLYMYFGRPGISKGVEYLVQSVPFVAQKIPNSKLLLILAKDPANRYKSIKKMIEGLNIEDKLVLFEPVPRAEMPDYIAAADCVVVPSLSEGFGFTAAEACAMGKPVVASNVGSLPEVVSGKYVLVEPKNPEAIAEGVEKVYQGEVEDKGKKIFSWDECIERYVGLYNEICS